MYSRPYESMKITYYNIYVTINKGKLIHTYNDINIYFNNGYFYIVKKHRAFEIKATSFTTPMICKNKLMLPQELDILKRKSDNITFCALIFDLDTLLFQCLEINEDYLKEFIPLKL